jgi:hypothetical protein
VAPTAAPTASAAAAEATATSAATTTASRARLATAPAACNNTQPGIASSMQTSGKPKPRTAERSQAPSVRTAPYNRRGAAGVPRTCQNCHQLKANHYDGNKKFMKTGPSCPRAPCAGQAGQGKCDKKTCGCFVEDPQAVRLWHDSRTG